MPSTSQRAQRTPLSPFRKLIPLADQARQQGTHVYHLNIGQPDIKTPAAAMAAVRGAEIPVLAYSPAEGELSLRQALTGYYSRFRIEVTAEEVMVTTGASEAILFFMLACLDPGDEIIVPEPFYANYNGFAHMAGVKIVPVTSHISDGFALPPVEEIAAQVTDRTRAVFINNPNNPTGCCYSRDALQELAGLVRHHDLFLCSDEVYREFTYGDRDFYSVLRLQGLEDHAIVIDSISKRYSACGARIGALVTRNAAVREAVGRFARLRLSPPGLGQVLAERLLDNDTDYLDETWAEYRRRRDVVSRRLAGMPGVDSYLPGGAFYCFIRLPGIDTEQFCRWLLTDFSYRGATVMLSPGAGFYATPGMGEDELRIAYVLNENDLAAAMDCLEQALIQYPHRLESSQQPFQAVSH